VGGRERRSLSSREGGTLAGPLAPKLWCVKPMFHCFASYPFSGSDWSQLCLESTEQSWWPQRSLLRRRARQHLRKSFCQFKIREGESTGLSQSHRMVGVGRDLCGSPSPTPCPSRVTQSRLHSTASRRLLSISREGESTQTGFCHRKKNLP